MNNNDNSILNKFLPMYRFKREIVFSNVNWVIIIRIIQLNLRYNRMVYCWLTWLQESISLSAAWINYAFLYLIMEKVIEDSSKINYGNNFLRTTIVCLYVNFTRKIVTIYDRFISYNLYKAYKSGIITCTCEVSGYFIIHSRTILGSRILSYVIKLALYRESYNFYCNIHISLLTHHKIIVKY